MGKFRLSKAAEQDLINIANFGDAQFGIARSDKYREKLKRRFSIREAQPMLYPAVDHISAGYRRSVCGMTQIIESPEYPGRFKDANATRQLATNLQLCD